MYKINEIKNKFLYGDTLKELKKFPSNCIDTIVTSPPYFSLRDYQVKGQLGLEKTVHVYIQNLLLVTQELKRILKPSGVMFWNHADTWNSKGKNDTNDFQAKCMLLQNYRLLLPMIDKQKWILINIIVWLKTNAKPFSGKDRFNNMFEPIYFLTKSQKYWFDLDSVRQPLSKNSLTRMKYNIQAFARHCFRSFYGNRDNCRSG